MVVEGKCVCVRVCYPASKMQQKEEGQVMVCGRGCVCVCEREITFQLNFSGLSGRVCGGDTCSLSDNNRTFSGLCQLVVRLSGATWARFSHVTVMYTQVFHWLFDAFESRHETHVFRGGNYKYGDRVMACNAAGAVGAYVEG